MGASTALERATSEIVEDAQASLTGPFTKLQLPHMHALLMSCMLYINVNAYLLIYLSFYLSPPAYRAGALSCGFAGRAK